MGRFKVTSHAEFIGIYPIHAQDDVYTIEHVLHHKELLLAYFVLANVQVRVC
jgi:hypothetical protein